MKRYTASRSSYNDENVNVSSRPKGLATSANQQLSNTTALSNRTQTARARIGLNERASIQTLDHGTHSLGAQKPKKIAVYADENQGSTSTAAEKYITDRKPLSERLIQDNVMSDDDVDYKAYPGNSDEDVDDVATLDDTDRLGNDEDEDAEDDYEDDEYAPMSPEWNSKIYQELQRAVTRFSRETLDEEDEDTTDISMVAEYAPEIFNYMHELEARLTPNSRYMDQQDELEWSMRSTLVGWLVQVHQRFNLLPETLFLTINYMDRFLSKRKVSLSRFQLVGAVALFIAAKYEEINCPSIQEIAYMVDHAYSVEDLLKAEKFMIGILEFEMGWPGPMSFLRRTSKADDYDFETRTLAKYFLEITIMDSRFVASPPSWLAAGAHYLARRLLDKGSWTEAHVFYSGYTEDQLRPLADVLISLCEDPVKTHNAIYEKYLERRYRRSASFVQGWINQVRMGEMA